MTNLAQNLADSGVNHADRTAVKLDDIELNYAAVDVGSQLVAGLLAEKGVKPGDRVGLVVPNVPYFIPIYYGILRLGAIVVPMNVLLKQREVDFYLSDSGADQIFVWHDFAAEAPDDAIVVKPGEFEAVLAAAAPFSEVAEAADDDTAVLLYTSGTTGTPKGAELMHGNLSYNAETVAEMVGLKTDDVIFGALPLFHVFGQVCCMNIAVKRGASITLLPRFEPGKALEMLSRDKVTIFEGVPTMYVAMLNSPGAATANADNLRICVSGGASLPVEVLRGFEERFDCKILEGYGLSETTAGVTFNHPDKERKPGSIGTAMQSVEIRLLGDDGNDVGPGEVGEIVLKGKQLMKGYWNKPEATAEAINADGWFHTGDLAKVDDDGYYFIVDRKKDLIIRGGYNVYPREIEEVIYEHPAVMEAAVVGVPHDELGEEVAAAIVFKSGESATAREISEFVKERVAAYKYPRLVWFPDELPKGPTGKIMKREIVVPETVAEQANA
ncbi:MAG TPA: long-chain fatty acid--CoA ligase [Solirubrobacterales bacterium]|nr:long-chain fatty acid--CoA ligase [Solirubrobacterales bacterium]